MVPETRIELVRVAPHAPQTCVSTISTTPALNIGKYIKKYLISQAFLANAERPSEKHKPQKTRLRPTGGKVRKTQPEHFS